MYSPHYFPLRLVAMRSPLSLKGIIEGYLAPKLDMTPAALYERQRALVRAGLITGKEGRGPGSGVRATPHSVAMLLIAVLSADSLSEIEESTKRFAFLRAEKGTCPITGKKTFASAIAAILASPKLANSAHAISVNRGRPSAHIDFVIEDTEPSSWFVSAKHKPRGMLDARASLLGFPLKELARLMAVWFADVGSDEELQAMKSPLHGEQQ